MLRGAAASLREHRDFDAPWRRDPFDREREIDRLVERLRKLAAVAPGALHPKTYLARSFLEIAKFVEELELLENLRGRDYDGLEGEVRRFARERHWGWRGAAGKPFTDMERPFVKCRRRSFLSHTSSFCSSAGSRKGRTRQGASTTSHSDIRDYEVAGVSRTNFSWRVGGD